MESGSVTTPFGRRPMSFAMLANQIASRDINTEKSVDKWKLYRALCEARPLLGITDRALALLNALLSFYPKAELSRESGLVVFPSNAQLSLRAHGMAEQTIRRHLAVLIKAGLLIRKDSPNGKRYAHKTRGGDISEAFGFSLAPLLARSQEIERLAAQVAAERLHMQHLRERLTLCRRDISKLVQAAVVEGITGDWESILVQQRNLLARLPRIANARELEDALSDLSTLREGVLNYLENQLKEQNDSANPSQNERHIQNSESESTSESEGNFEAVQPAIAEQQLSGKLKPKAPIREQLKQINGIVARTTAALKAYPLSLVLQACPQIADYAGSHIVTNWRDLMSAATVVRMMLGVSPSAYQDACAVMGPENTAAVMACILERGGHIYSAGAYLRDLTRRAGRGEFALGPMLMALLRNQEINERKGG